MADITLRRVRKSYGRNEVIHGVDLSIASGEFVVILGPSGCGKSTLLRMVAGLEAITTGEIRIADTVVNKLEPRERGCAMVFQNYALYPHMSVAENIGYALRVAGLPKKDRTERVNRVADALGLREFLDRKPGQLSGGQRQRVAMGRAMIREPRVFLYDEPLSNLDARLRVAMRIEIRRLHEKLGTTTLFVTHDQVEAMTLADRIVVMNKGVIEQVGTPREVYVRPATLYVAGFVGAPGLNLLKGAADPDRALIRLTDGQALPYDRRRWPAVPAAPLVVGFRAEAARIVPLSEGLAMTHAFDEELGASRLVHGTIGQEAVVVADAGREERRAGDRFGITVDPRDIHLFDARSQERLDEEPEAIESERAVA